MSDKSYSSKLARLSPLFIGIDLGTSGCRAIAIDSSGNIKAESKISYFDQALRNQENLNKEINPHHKQTPEDWWNATQSVLKDITSQVKHHHIQAIAVDGTSSTVLFCNDAGRPLGPVLMYDETHALTQAEFLKNYAPEDSIVLSSTSGLAKILWLHEHHKPEGKFHIVHQADWVAGKLCGRFDFSDINNALKTGFDPNNKIWPLWLLDLFSELKIDKTSLPKVFMPGALVANINLDIAAELGLPVDVDIIAGTTDSTAAFIASGATKPGQAVTSLGSTLVLKVISDTEINRPAYGIYSQPYGENWLVGGASNSGGAVLSYYFNEEQMQTLSKQIKPDRETDLDYYPLLEMGERFPINDPNLMPRITPSVDDDDVQFFQGLLEGIANIEHTGYKLLTQLGAPYPTSIQTAGGGAVNKPWQEIRENKMGVAVTASAYNAAAYGAAKLSAKII